MVFVESSWEMEISRVEFDEYIMLNHFTCEFMISVSVALALCAQQHQHFIAWKRMLSADSRSERVLRDV